MNPYVKIAPMAYNPQEIEKKWQLIWETKRPYKAVNPGEPQFDPNKPHYYVLDMFPYPSGSGLHVGHASGYIGTDIIARKKRMEGFNVLHPMGWDAFGLPAEQYAIQTGQHPRETTDINTANFRKQLKLLGLSYDWDREIDTSDPKYYKWTQWVFLQLYKKGLVYRKEMPVWWCEELKTVLANEEVINGRSERGNFPCERRPLTQWVFKITAYADRLLEDLEGLDWPANVIKMQQDWIGKSEGAEIRFAIDSQNLKTAIEDSVMVFSTRVDTLFGVVAVVLAPEHPLTEKIMASLDPAKCVASDLDTAKSYIAASKSKSDRERKAEVETLTGAFTGAYCTHPLTQEKVPIWIGDYVLADYGTGAVMAVPAHDERDFQLAKAKGLPMLPVIAPHPKNADMFATSSDKEPKCFVDEGVLINSGEFTGLESAVARTKITKKLQELGQGSSRISYKIRDWIFSRQRYWGEPFPLNLTESGEVIPCDEADLPVTLPSMQDFKPAADGSSPLARVREWVTAPKAKDGQQLYRVTDTMPGWAGSCWYYLRFMDPHNDRQAWSQDVAKYWHSVDLYVGGASHAVMHLLYARFWHKALFDLGLVPTKEPFQKLFNQGMVTAFAYKDATQRLVPSDEVEAVGQGFRRKTTGEPVERIITKMAKSLRNVVNPDDVVQSKGCDVLRVYEMFMGPLDAEKPWADEGIAGSEKFLRRVWNLFVNDKDELAPSLKQSLNHSLNPANQAAKGDKKIDQALHKCLKRIDESFVNFNFNTAIAAMMECMNDMHATGSQITKTQGEMFLKMLAPFAPHITSEIWQRLGNVGFIDFAQWPALDLAMLYSDEYELVIQVNGKIRGKKLVDVSIDEPAAIKIAEAEVPDHLAGKQIVKIIFVKNKLINIVVR